MNQTRTLTVFLCLTLAVCAAGQASNNNAPAQPVSYSSISELNTLISGLQDASQATQMDIARLRIEKWKTDSNTKKQTQSDSESVARNLQNALPGMLNDLKNSPENLALTFKVYRNLDALYDVMNSLVESAGAFGGKEEFQTLNKDLGSLESSRRAFADRMDKLANSKETEIADLRVALQNARAATPPKKTVIDDTEPTTPAKKPTVKKKVPKPGTKPPATTNTQPQPQQ